MRVANSGDATGKFLLSLMIAAATLAGGASASAVAPVSSAFVATATAQVQASAPALVQAVPTLGPAVAIGRAIAAGSIPGGPPVPPVSLAVPSAPIVPATSVGYLPGSSTVSATGQYQYSIPIVVPSGRSGMQPNLSLNYSSDGGNGLLGVGWSLSAGSNIVRCGHTLAQEGRVRGVHYTDFSNATPEPDRDRLCLDGNKLVAIKGGYGQNGAEYRTEHDSQTRIVSAGVGASPDSFTVTLGNGVQRVYKARKGKRYSSNLSGYGAGSEVTTYWALSTETDPYGNGVKYEYVLSDGGSDGSQDLLDAIVYTTHPSVGAYRMVKFTYDDTRTDKELSWLSGVPGRLRQRMKAITMYAPNPGPNNGPNNPAQPSPVWKYEFSFAYSGFSGRSLLQSVRYCATKGEQNNGCLWKKVFSWPEQSGSPVAFVKHANRYTAASGRSIVTPAGLNDRLQSFSMEDEDFKGYDSPARHTPFTTAGAAGSGVSLKVLRASNDAGRDDMAIALGSDGLNAALDGDWNLPLGTKALLVGNSAGDSYTASPWSAWREPGQYTPGPNEYGAEYVRRYRDWLNNYSVVDVGADGTNEVFSPDWIPQNVFCRMQFRRWATNKFTSSTLPESIQFQDQFLCIDHEHSSHPESWATLDSSDDLAGAYAFADVDGDGRSDFLAAPPEKFTGVGNDAPGAPGQLGSWRYGLQRDAGFDALSARPAEPADGPSTDVSGSCPIRVVDFTGDGRAQLFGQVHAHTTLKPSVVDIDIDSVTCGAGALTRLEDGQWTTDVDVDGRWPRVVQGKVLPIGFLSQWPVDADEQQGLKVGRPEYDLHFGDYNGDGLTDVIEPESPGKLVVRWNTGNGFGPPGAAIAGMGWTAAPQYWAFPDTIVGDGSKSIQIRRKNYKVVPADVDRDGRTDLVVFYAETSSKNVAPDIRYTKAFLSNGDGTFESVAIDDDSALYSRFGGGILGDLGDFNGDGSVDIARIRGTGPLISDGMAQGSLGSIAVDVLLQTPLVADRIVSVRNEGEAVGVQEAVTYSTRWSDAPGKMSGDTCTYPLRCIRKGLLVVRQVTRTGDVADTAPASAHSVFYSYDDPVADMKGRGFLGFATVRRWDPSIPTETVTTYDNRTRKEGQNANGATYYYYPFAGRPSTIQTVTPIMPAAQAANKPASATARIVATNYVPEFQPLPGDATAVQRPRYAVYTKQKIVKEWEESVTIDWKLPALGDADLATPTRSHVAGIDASTTAKKATVTYTNDAYGNAEKVERVTSYGPTTGSRTTVEAAYEYRTSAGQWLLGLPLWQKTTSTKHQNPGSQATLSNRIDYRFDALGGLDTAWVEKDNADAKLRSTVTLTYDAFGHVVSSTLAARENEAAAVDSTRTRHVEYAPFYPGAPDERIHASQIWAEHGNPDCEAVGKDCRPSTWMAVHPAYGVAVTTMDVNGVQSYATFDALGRAAAEWRQGEQATYFSYDGRSDQAGGINGTKVTAQADDQIVTVATDRSGRTLWTTRRGFDGAQILAASSYDATGRLVAASRPYFVNGGTAQWTKPDYDSLGRVLKVVRPDGTFTKNAYQGLFQSTHWDEEGDGTTTALDVDGQVVRTWSAVADCPSPASSVGCIATDVGTDYRYGAFGLLQQVFNAQGKTSNDTTYDLLGRPVSNTELDAGATSLVYNGFGEIVSATRTGVGTSTSTYDDLGRPLSSTSPDGTRTNQWDSAEHGIGMLASSTGVTQQDGRQFRHVFGYDALGRPLKTSLVFLLNGVAAATYEVEAGYDAQGRLATLEYPEVPGRNRLVVQHTYNPYGYLDKVTDVTSGEAPKVLLQATQRNADLALTQAFAGGGAIGIQRSYEPLTGRLKTLDYQYGAGAGTDLLKVDYAYWADGLVKSRTTDDAQQMRIETFDYDSLARLTHWGLMHKCSSYCAWNTAPTTGYQYDTTGNLTGVWKDAAQVEQRSYGNNGTRPHTLTDLWDKTTNQHTAYQYDTAGRMYQDAKRNLTYNAFDLPRTVTQGAQTWKFWYDPSGRRVLKTGPDGSTLYVGSLFERRTAPGAGVTDVFHVQGADGTSAQINYVEGAGPNIASVKVFANKTDHALAPNTDLTVPVAVSGVPVNAAASAAKVEVDIADTFPSRFNLKLKRPDGTIHVLHKGLLGPATPTNFNSDYTVTVPAGLAVNGSWTLIVEGAAGAAGTLQNWSLAFTTSSPNPSTVYALSDALGSTAVVVNQQGTILERSYYDPFGQPVNSDGSVSGSVAGKLVKHGFTGQEHEDAFGLINFKGRMYDPRMKRFLTPDPAVSAPGFSQSWNPYSYVMNSPLNRIDPGGWQDCSASVNGGQICSSAPGGDLSTTHTDRPAGGSTPAPGGADNSGGSRYGGRVGTGPVDDSKKSGRPPGSDGGWGAAGQMPPMNQPTGGAASGSGASTGARHDAAVSVDPDGAGYSGFFGASADPGNRSSPDQTSNAPFVQWQGDATYAEFCQGAYGNSTCIGTPYWKQHETTETAITVLFDAVLHAVPGAKQALNRALAPSAAKLESAGLPRIITGTAHGKAITLAIEETRAGNAISYLTGSTVDDQILLARQMIGENADLMVVIGKGGHGGFHQGVARSFLSTARLVDGTLLARGRALVSTGNPGIYFLDLTDPVSRRIFEAWEKEAAQGIGSIGTVRGWCFSCFDPVLPPFPEP